MVCVSKRHNEGKRSECGRIERRRRCKRSKSRAALSCPVSGKSCPLSDARHLPLQLWLSFRGFPHLLLPPRRNPGRPCSLSAPMIVGSAEPTSRTRSRTAVLMSCHGGAGQFLQWLRIRSRSQMPECCIGRPHAAGRGERRRRRRGGGKKVTGAESGTWPSTPINAPLPSEYPDNHQPRITQLHDLIDGLPSFHCSIF